ncbi:hypothetical protein PENTCL1PPCAC_12589, partial [Pristionchus entomophagus]
SVESGQESAPFSEGNREYVECGVCFEPLHQKRTASLRCGDLMHRTCLINFCESTLNEDRQFFCPICNEGYQDCFLFDEKHQLLTDILSFGPTGQPSIKQWLAHSLDFPSIISTAHKYIVNTSKWLLKISEDLNEARVSDQRDSFVEDILEERKKLLERYDILNSILEERKILMMRINAAANELHPMVNEENVDVATEKSSRISVKRDHGSKSNENQLILTAKWLLQVSLELKSAYESRTKSADYIQDVVEEMKRIFTIYQQKMKLMEEECDCQARQEPTADLHTPSRKYFTTSIIRNNDTAEFACQDDGPTCAVCLE